ncbi:dTMP kinase [Paenibacillus sp. MMS18-CY102]|uniref:dTMP kinase n=1 Tax=Paenibacillus sp. MMS18-CY102 TaxID=2682849 RepID=UPI0013663252|nr:dTMP kinase [Paenibacillus sp. MMS18-CY102]MWC30578.1 dTMP kinase [Paenibacillus sp. MMS18-CY102]
MSMQPHQSPGKLIAMCGVDGSGKSTMIELLYKELLTRYPSEQLVFTKQPRDIVREMDIFKKMMYTPNPNVDYRAVLLLTLSERMQHAHEEIIPALREGKIVVSDRYVYTSIANMRARGYLNETWFFDVMKYLPKPDLVFLANVSADLSISRVKERESEKDCYLNENLHRDVTEQFCKLVDEMGIISIDTTRSPMKAFEDIKVAVDGLLNGTGGA